MQIVDLLLLSKNISIQYKELFLARIKSLNCLKASKKIRVLKIYKNDFMMLVIFIGANANFGKIHVQLSRTETKPLFLKKMKFGILTILKTGI